MLNLTQKESDISYLRYNIHSRIVVSSYNLHFLFEDNFYDAIDIAAPSRRPRRRPPRRRRLPRADNVAVAVVASRVLRLALYPPSIRRRLVVVVVDDDDRAPRTEEPGGDAREQRLPRRRGERQAHIQQDEAEQAR